jgi:hypothetical protein
LIASVFHQKWPDIGYNEASLGLEQEEIEYERQLWMNLKEDVQFYCLCRLLLPMRS